MIVSASRRTDIPAFYSKWFINGVRRGWCLVPNPFNRFQVSRIALDPGSVDAFVFWTRDPRPLLNYLDELDAMGHRYIFLYTMLGYPRRIDPGAPSLSVSTKTFRKLSDRIGPDRISWRYDPILLGPATPASFHIENFGKIARTLAGSTNRCIISFVQPYRKARARLEAAAPGSANPVDFTHPDVVLMLRSIEASARENGMQVFACAMEEDFSGLGIQHSKCIDAEGISKTFGIGIDAPKDPHQRPQCGCSASRDIGASDTCVFGCSYCYATNSPERARANHARHDPESPSLI
ncbi:MAG: DUF1848 domain-containing protein [Desulfobacteraceae bacterium]|nr:DUF1848 domain-containing protein [Desulfobacteraceae bacterium]